MRIILAPWVSSCINCGCWIISDSVFRIFIGINCLTTILPLGKHYLLLGLYTTCIDHSMIRMISYGLDIGLGLGHNVYSDWTQIRTL